MYNSLLMCWCTHDHVGFLMKVESYVVGSSHAQSTLRKPSHSNEIAVNGLERDEAA